MAEHAASGPAETGAPMDYDEHEQTYSGFVAFTGLAAVATINVLIALAIFAFGNGGGAFWIGMLVLVLTTAAAVLGIVFKGAWKYSGVVTIVAVLAMILTVAS
jgi:hypothetical protein